MTSLWENPFFSEFWLYTTNVDRFMYLFPSNTISIETKKLGSKQLKYLPFIELVSKENPLSVTAKDGCPKATCSNGTYHVGDETRLTDCGLI